MGFGVGKAAPLTQHQGLSSHAPTNVCSYISKSAFKYFILLEHRTLLFVLDRRGSERLIAND